MEGMLVAEILECTGGKLLKGQKNQYVTSISTDTRSLKKGDLFIALEGENFDGNEFVGDAVKAGAMGVVICKDIKDFNGDLLIKVKDTLDALKNIAKCYLTRFKNIPVIGITGSNGKTTTKDITAHILGMNKKVLKARDSFNNAIGISLTLFELDHSYEYVILEYGTNKNKEIESLTKIVSPDISVLTNIGRTHLKFFKTERNVFKEKFSLVKNTKRGGVVILNADDKYLSALTKKIKYKKLITFGITGKADVSASNIVDLKERGSRFSLEMNGEETTVVLPLLGLHNVYNAMASAAVAAALKIKLELIKQALESFKSDSSHRLQKFEEEGVLIIDDTYNANPESVKEALKVLNNLNGKRKIVVLGDMVELGELEEKLHRDIGRLVKEHNIDFLITVGSVSKNICLSALKEGMSKERAFHFNDKVKAYETLRWLLKKNDVVLVKGSRKMKMEDIVLSLNNLRR